MLYQVFAVRKCVLELVEHGDDDVFEGIEGVLPVVQDYRGWPSLEVLHEEIRKWAAAEDRRPGTTYYTAKAVIVCIPDVPPEGVCPNCNWLDADVGRLRPTNRGIQRVITCARCGTAWAEEYTLAGYRQVPVKFKSR